MFSINSRKGVKVLENGHSVFTERTRDIKPIDTSKAYVIAMCSNPARSRSRYDLFRRFEQHILDTGVPKENFYKVEVAYGQRKYEVTQSDVRQHLQLRTEYEEIWLKEPGWNAALRDLPNDWEYVIFLDGDIQFTNPMWFSETVHQLQTYQMVQPFAQAIDLGPDFEIVQTHQGFAYMYHQNMFNPPKGAGYSDYYGANTRKNAFWHPGYGVAFRREVFEGRTGTPGLTGLLEAPLGAGDHHMWLCAIGCGSRSIPKGISDGYRKMVLDFEKDILAVVKKDIGYTPGTITTGHHGPKAKRYYIERWDLLTENKWDPRFDIRKDWQGLPQLLVKDERQIRIRDLFRAYFRARSEDDPNT